MIVDGENLLKYNLAGISSIIKDRDVVVIVSKGVFGVLAVISLLKACNKLYLIDSSETEYEIARKLKNIEYDYIVKILDNVILIMDKNDKKLYKSNIKQILKKDIKIDCNIAKIVFFTSGTTDVSKQVEHEWNKIIEVSKYECDFLQIRASDIITSSAPVTYTYGFGCLVTIPCISKCKVDLTQNISNSTIFATTPTYIMEYLRSHKLLNVKLKYLLTSGEKLYKWQYNTILEKLKNNMDNKDFKILEFLGTTETFHGIILNPPNKPKPGSIGVPLPCYKIKIKVKNKICNLFETGELNIKGYIGKVNNKMLGRGWYYTGDLVYRDCEDYIWFVSREDDIINIGGTLVSPCEIEEVILSSGLVEDCTVYSVPDPFTGEKPVAEVVMLTEKKEDRKILENYVRHKLSKWKYPIFRYKRYITYSKRGKKIRKFIKHL